jgi:hypothetical protein
MSKMAKMLLILFVIFSFLGKCEDGFGQFLYKWIDEEGNVHFSEDPPPETSVKEKKQPPIENTAKILKKLEYGNREIPEDMKKYGPGGGGVSQSRQGQTGGSSSQSSKSVVIRRG